MLLSICAKCSDLCDSTLKTTDGKIIAERDGYVPNGLGIGGDDYVEFTIDLSTGQIVNFSPISDAAAKAAFSDESYDDDEEEEESDPLLFGVSTADDGAFVTIVPSSIWNDHRRIPHSDQLYLLTKIDRSFETFFEELAGNLLFSSANSDETRDKLESHGLVYDQDVSDKLDERILGAFK